MAVGRQPGRHVSRLDGRQHMIVSRVDRISPDSPRHAYEHSVKSHLVDYWGERAEDFAELHNKELASPKRDAWLAEILPCLPQAPEGRRLRILDVGCGSGFIALILADLGHEVRGIDLTPEMIAEARAEAARVGSTATFELRDAEDTGLAPGSFDVIVTRNLTWALPHLAHAYAHWHELLAPGGVLVNFDGDYAHERPLRELEVPAENAHADISRSLAREYEHIKEHLVAEQKPRPAWDLDLLAQAGFTDIELDEHISERLYAEPDIFYNPTPMFRITAHS